MWEEGRREEESVKGERGREEERERVCVCVCVKGERERKRERERTYIFSLEVESNMFLKGLGPSGINKSPALSNGEAGTPSIRD